MKTFRKISSGIASGALALSSFAVLISPTAVHAAAQTCTWTGGGGDKKFSTVVNWKDCGGGVPKAGDVVRFIGSLLSQDGENEYKLTNDLGVDLGGIELDDDTSSSLQYPLWISTASIVDGGYMAAMSSGANHFYPQINIGSGYDAVGTVKSKGNLELKSNTGGMFDLDVPGVLKLNDQTYFTNEVKTGSVEVVSGTAYLLFGSQTEDVTEINHTTPVTVRSGATADMYFWSACADFSAFGVMGRSNCNVTQPTTYNYSGALTVEGSAIFRSDLDTTVNMTGEVIGVDKITRANGSGVLNIGSTQIVTPKKETTYSGEKPSEDIVVSENETATMADGATRGMATIYTGGVLKGTGVFTSMIFVSRGGVIAPGMSPGCITADKMRLNGEYQFEIGGTEACTGYDQIKLTGAETDMTSLLLNDAILTTSRFDNYTPKQGEVYTIIDVGGSLAVEGTFKDLPEDATFEQNGIVFKISYVGGDGNDVTLTVMNQPTAPDTGFMALKSNPVLAAVATVVVAGALAVVGRKLQASRR